MISPSVVTPELSATAKSAAILLSKIAVTLFPGIFFRDLLTLSSRWIDTSTCWLNKSTDQSGISPNTINTLFIRKATRIFKIISLGNRLMQNQIPTTYVKRNLSKSVGRIERSISFIITKCGFFYWVKSWSWPSSLDLLLFTCLVSPGATEHDWTAMSIF